MQGSRISLNSVSLNNEIISAKFEKIKANIEKHSDKVHIIYSNYIDGGILGFI